MTVLDPKTVHGAQNGLQRDVDALLARMEPLVRSAARKFANGSTIPVEDLKQDCWLAIFECLETFDADKGSFESWCYGPMRNAMKETSSELTAGPSVPARTASRYFASVEGDASMDPETFSAVHSVMSDTYSTSAFSDSDADRFEIVDRDDYYEGAVNRLFVDRLLECLPEREAYVVRLWSGLETGEPLNDTEVADALGVTRTMAQKIRYRAIERLQAQEADREA